MREMVKIALAEDKLMFLTKIFVRKREIDPLDSMHAHTSSLFEKNSRSDVGNYRPVSIVSIVSKILGKAVTRSQKRTSLVVI